MGKRPYSPQRLDHVDRRSQVGVSGAMRARDVSRPTDEDTATDAADAGEVDEKGRDTGDRQPRPRQD